MSQSAVLPRRRARVTPRAVVLFVLVVAMLIAVIAPFRQYLDQRSHLAELQRSVTELEGRNLELQQEAVRLHDPHYIEYLARKCLGMVKKGEIAFVTVPEGGEPQPPSC
ncbi:MAG: septum formation initiator family protein [Actinobacteria bacterium]|nr:septum formation initiator family protein [Actinomycetota bacterium]